MCVAQLLRTAGQGDAATRMALWQRCGDDGRYLKALQVLDSICKTPHRIPGKSKGVPVCDPAVAG